MALRTYTFKVGGRQLAAKMTKDHAERLARELQTPSSCAHYVQELCGITGKSEHATVLYSPFTVYELPDPEGYKADLASYVSNLPELLTDENYKPHVIAARKLLNKHMATADKRRTVEEDRQQVEAANALEKAHEAKTDVWVAEFCADIERTPIPDNQMAVTLTATFNDSDSMTDYYSPHCPVNNSVTMLLATVPQQPKTERLARSIVARYPELAKLEFAWHTENYSMGHGNYLISGYIGKADQKAYNGREEVNWCWEVEFMSWQKELYPFRGYPGDNTPAPKPTNGNGNVTVKHNLELDGIEIAFAAKPDASVLTSLKQNGFRWSQRQGLWYARFSESKWAYIQSLT